MNIEVTMLGVFWVTSNMWSNLIGSVSAIPRTLLYFSLKRQCYCVSSIYGHDNVIERWVTFTRYCLECNNLIGYFFYPLAVTSKIFSSLQDNVKSFSLPNFEKQIVALGMMQFSNIEMKFQVKKRMRNIALDNCYCCTG